MDGRGDSRGAERREEMVEMVEVCNCETPGRLSNLTARNLLTQVIIHRSRLNDGLLPR